MPKFKFTVTDLDHVLPRFIATTGGDERVLDAAALQADIDAGLRNTPGVVITELPEEVPAPVVAAARARGAAKDAPGC